MDVRFFLSFYFLSDISFYLFPSGCYSFKVSPDWNKYRWFVLCLKTKSLRRECPPSFFTDILTCPLFHCCCSWNHTMTHNDRGWGNQRTLVCRLFCIFPRVQLHFSAHKCVKSISPNVSLTFYKHTGSLSWHLRKMYTYLEQNWIQNTKTWPSLRIITNVI